MEGKGRFDIINDISEKIISMQLMETVGNINHAVSIVGYCISDSNYKNHFRLQRNYLISYALLRKGKECLPCLKQYFMRSYKSTIEAKKIMVSF